MISLSYASFGFLLFLLFVFQFPVHTDYVVCRLPIHHTRRTNQPSLPLLLRAFSACLIAYLTTIMKEEEVIAFLLYCLPDKNASINL